MTTKCRRTGGGDSRITRWLGIDVGGTTMKAALVILPTGRILHSACVPTSAVDGAQPALERMSQLARGVMEHGLRQWGGIEGVGIALPELVDIRGRTASRATLDWTTRAVRQSLKDLGRAVVCSDVQAAALAESRFGAGRRLRVFLYISVGTGVSSSLVIGGRPFPGARGCAVAFASGKTSLDDLDRPQSLESRVAGPALYQRAPKLGLRVNSTEEVCRLADAEPGVARTLVEDAASELACHVAILANALDPAAVVVGGGLGSAAGRYWQTFAANLSDFLYGSLMSELRVKQAKLGPWSGAVGAAAFGSQSMYPRGGGGAP